MQDQQLFWIQKNRCRRASANKMTTLIEAYRGSPRMTRLSRQCRLVDVVEQHTGAKLMKKVEWMTQSGGTLVFRVKRASECYTLGVHWRQILLRIIQAKAPQFGIKEIRFLPAEADNDRRE